MIQIENNTSDALNPNREILSFLDHQGTKIEAKSSMKILGFMMNSRMSMDNHLSKMKSKMGIELSKLKPFLNLMS